MQTVSNYIYLVLIFLKNSLKKTIIRYIENNLFKIAYKNVIIFINNS